MEEGVATPLDHSFILDHRVLCDDRSTLGSIYGQAFNSSQESKNFQDLVVILTYMQERLMSVHALAFFNFYLQRTTLLLLEAGQCPPWAGR